MTHEHMQISVAEYTRLHEAPREVQRLRARLAEVEAERDTLKQSYIDENEVRAAAEARAEQAERRADSLQSGDHLHEVIGQERAAAAAEGYAKGRAEATEAAARYHDEQVAGCARAHARLVQDLGPEAPSVIANGGKREAHRSSARALRPSTHRKAPGAPRPPAGCTWLGSMSWGGNGEREAPGFVAGLVCLSNSEFEPDEYVWLDAEGWHEQGEPSAKRRAAMQRAIERHPDVLAHRKAPGCNSCKHVESDGFDGAAFCGHERAPSDNQLHGTGDGGAMSWCPLRPTHRKAPDDAALEADKVNPQWTGHGPTEWRWDGNAGTWVAAWAYGHLHVRRLGESDDLGIAVPDHIVDRCLQDRPTHRKGDAGPAATTCEMCHGTAAGCDFCGREPDTGRPPVPTDGPDDNLCYKPVMMGHGNDFECERPEGHPGPCGLHCHEPVAGPCARPSDEGDTEQ